MQPYQQASKEILRQSEEPGKALSAISKTAAGLAGGGAILNRIMPFLNSHISPELAKKGISKIDPRLGKFIQGSLNQGNSMEEVTEFIKEKATGEKSSKIKEDRKNLIEEHAPEVYEILKDKIGQGLKPLAVAFQLSQDANFKNKIEDLQKKTGSPFSQLVTSIFGGQEEQQGQSSKPQQMQEAQQIQGQTQQGQGTQNLMAALQAAAQARQRRQQR